MTTLWCLMALGFLVFVGLTFPGVWEEHKRGELERSVLEFTKSLNTFSVSITASHKQVMEFSKALNKVMAERR